MNTKIAIATLAATATASAVAIGTQSATLDTEILSAQDYQFMEFVSTHGRSFGTKAEFQFRSKVFKNKLAEVERLNAVQDTAVYGVNAFSDRTESEMKKMLGFNGKASDNATATILDTSNLASSVDWRD